MNVLELINEVREAGATLRADGNDLVIKPADRIQPDLKARLKEHKAELLAMLQGAVKLVASAKRLEAARISIAVWPEGSMLVVTENAVGQAWMDGGAVFAPREMLLYLSLSEAERQIMRGIKRLKP